MHYRDSNRSLDRPKKILKVNHAGEFGVICIYRAQLALGKSGVMACTWAVESVVANHRDLDE